MSVIDRIADLSRDRGVKHVLVAGDVFDTESGKSSLYHQPIAKLQSHRHVIWHLLPGNHDPAANGRLASGLARLMMKQQSFFVRPACLSLTALQIFRGIAG